MYCTWLPLNAAEYKRLCACSDSTAGILCLSASIDSAVVKLDRQHLLLQEHGMADIWQNLLQSTQDAAFVEFVQLLVKLDPEQRVHQGSCLLGHPYLQATPTCMCQART